MTKQRGHDTSSQGNVESGSQMPSPWQLADSPWPRTAGDRRHSRRASVGGPCHRRIRRVLELAGEGPMGLAVAADGSLRASGRGQLFALAPTGQLLWQLVLGNPSARRSPSTSAPLLLADGTSVVIVGRSLVFVSSQGDQLARWRGDEALDDSVLAPNLDLQGNVVLTTQTGEVLRRRGVTLERLGQGFGYDIVPPAIDQHGRLAIAGYAGKGLVVVDSSGNLLWQSQLRDADLLPTIDRHGRVACGSLNDKESHIYDEAGRLLGRHGEPAAFAETEDGWVALSHDSLSGLDGDGRLRWRREGGALHRWGGLGPAVDRLGRIYAPQWWAPQGRAPDWHLLCLEPDGRERFVLPLPDEPFDLALVAEGRAALATAGGIIFVE
jgi:outer membrane protein assembly factor BamB